MARRPKTAAPRMTAMRIFVGKCRTQGLDRPDRHGYIAPIAFTGGPGA
ncbi:hypothetical protein ACSBOB_15170 [Mesorhizobium sp. ASY16-5R]